MALSIREKLQNIPGNMHLLTNNIEIRYSETSIARRGLSFNFVL